MLGRNLFGRQKFGYSAPSGVLSANAGVDKILPPGITSVTLSGTASGGVTNQTWTRESGPNLPTIANANSLSTQVTGLAPGTYIFRLTVDDGVTSAYDEVQVIARKKGIKGLSSIVIIDQKGASVSNAYDI